LDLDAVAVAARREGLGLVGADGEVGVVAAAAVRNVQVGVRIVDRVGAGVDLAKVEIGVVGLVEAADDVGIGRADRPKRPWRSWRRRCRRS
jgi:hypothetical protein